MNQNSLKKFLCLLLTLTALLGLAACGNGNNAAATTAAAQTTQPETVAETTAETAEETQAAPTTITLTDNVGREVELPYPVETCAVALRYTNERSVPAVPLTRLSRWT